MLIPLVGPAYTERSPDLNAQTCVNLYPVPGGPDGRAAAALYGTPGLSRFATIGTTPVHGMHVFGASLLAVSGRTLYRVGTDGIATGVGTLNSTAGRVAFADNGRAVMLVDGVNGYLWNGSALTQITDTSFPNGATQVAFLGGYFVFDKADGNPGEFMISKLYATDPTDAGNQFDALDYATAEADPDGLVALAALSGHLWLLGASTTEVWYHSGAAFPFDPIGGARSDRGCAAHWSVAKAGDALLWLSDDRQGRLQVVMTDGLGLRPVSTPALDWEFAGYESVADATAYAYQEGGHLFYVLTFPFEDATWVFDISMNMWHRRGGWNAPAWTRHRGEVYARFAGMHLVGDYLTGKVYRLDENAFSDDGAVIRRERVAPVLHADGKAVFFRKLEVFAQPGADVLGDTTPNVLLDWSDDGGRTFGPNLEGSLGGAGDYGARLVWWRLGTSRRRNFRVVISDPMRVVLMGAEADVEVGR